MTLDVLAAAFIAAGVAFLVVSAVGLLRFPDFYTRAHAVAKSETLGLLLLVVGLIILERFDPAALRLFLVLGFAMVANPTAIHALARAARRAGLEPWRRQAP